MNKTITLLLLCLTFAIKIQAQFPLVDNKGNRLQTYPEVTEINPEIFAMMEQVDTLNFYNSISWMQQYIRDAVSPEALLTQNWLLEQYEDMGLETQVYYLFEEYLSPDTLDAGNVIAIQRGTEFPDEYIIISSHYDHPDGPGADDNASGTAGVLECARILSQYSFKRSIMYINFNAEECGLVGSYYLSIKYAEENKDILGMLNLDMIGFWPSDMDSITMYTGYVPISEKLFDYYINVANIYRPDMPTYRFSDGKGAGGSDHLLFLYHDYPAMYIGDVEHIDIHPCYHRPCDTIGNGFNSFALAKGFTQATLAATAELVSGWLPPQDLSAIPNGDKITISWDETEEAVFYKLFRDGEMIAEPTENHYDDYTVEENVEYEYFVKAVNFDGKVTAESNHDIMKLSDLLELPFIEDFENGLDNLHFNISTWQLVDKPFSGDYSLTNDTAKVLQNYYACAELYGFSIPDTTQNVKLSFQCKNNSWASQPNAFIYFEVTKDRKSWHKLFKNIYLTPNWRLMEFSLNDFIGEPFVQIRCRIEGIGENDKYVRHSLLIDDIKIDFAPLMDVNEIQYDTFKELCVFPNPASSNIEISTDLKAPYTVSIYNLLGVKVLQKENFIDGSLNISSLEEGIYFVMINSKGNCLTKRIVIQ